MAVRLRKKIKAEAIGGFIWIALCAAEYPEEPGDIYIDDGQDHALRIKYIEDYKSEGIWFGTAARIKELEDAAREVVVACSELGDELRGLRIHKAIDALAAIIYWLECKGMEET